MLATNPQIKKLLEKNPIAFATVDQFGKPNVIGVAYVKVISAKKILITDNYMNQTIKNLKNNANVCLVAWDKKWQGVKLIGQALYFTQGEWIEYIKKIKENKNLPTKGAIVVNISKIIKLA